MKSKSNIIKNQFAMDKILINQVAYEVKDSRNQVVIENLLINQVVKGISSQIFI